LCLKWACGERKSVEQSIAETDESTTRLRKDLTAKDLTIFGVAVGVGARAWGFFAFIGLDVVATTAEETKNPQKAIPQGVLGTLAIVTVLYVAVTLVLTGMVNYTDLKSGSPLVGDSSATPATAFEAHGITWAQNAINIGLAGLNTVVMVMMLGQHESC
jgi:APA family basic amino acid/polyamine antiporter